MSSETAWNTEPFAAALATRYRIDRELGRGGMATVYLAQDIRHHRRVAIKVLRPEVAAAIGGERFLTEIRTTASLQHPHILGLIDSGDAGGALYYVMPFVDGESLRARLEREKHLPVDVALRLASEVAAALDYAHRQGVVHRDIKPENILLQDGSALVADFGIALALAAIGGDRLTQTGLSLGTPRYMAPEQAMGERVIDARADVYALGVVTYEMLAGEAPFTGPTAQAVISRVMTETPRALTTQRPSVAPYVEAAVLKAVAKIPADRFDTASQFAAALASPVVVPARAPLRPRAAPAFVAGAALALVAAIGAGWIVGQRMERGRAVTAPPSRLSLVRTGVMGSGQIALQRLIAITRDGTTLVYVAQGGDGLPHLVRQGLADADPTPIPGVKPGLATPFISADGRTVLGMASGERVAFRHPIAGGPGDPLPMPAGYTDFFDWDDRGAIWFSAANGGGIQRVAPGDSVAKEVDGSKGLRVQQVLPDGRHLLVMREATMLSGPAEIFDVESRTRTPLIASAIVEIRYAAGHLVYVLPNGTMHVVPFDLRRLRTTGPAVPVATDVAVSSGGIAQFAVAQNGTIAYSAEAPPTLAVVDRTGAARTALDAHFNLHGPRFSPDGRHISVDFNSETGRDIWILPTEGGAVSRATFAGDGHDATWTPDGKFITYLSAKAGGERIYKTRWSGAEPPEGLLASPQIAFTGVWLPDGSGLIAVMNDLKPGSGADVALITNAGRGPVQPLVATEFTESYPAVSPDGRWLAFTSDQSGRLDVYVRPVHGGGDQIQISLNGGNEAAWSPDGNEIFYRSVGEAQPQLIAASLKYAPSLAVTGRKPLFPVADYVGTQPHVGYDVSPDGRAFVMVKRSPAARIVVLQNLTAMANR